MLDQCPQYVVLSRSQESLRAIDRNDPGSQIDGQIAVSKVGVRFWLGGAAQSHTDAGHELGRAEWLGQVIIRASVQRPDLLCFLFSYGNDNDRYLGPFPESTCYVHAVDVRQPQVQDDQVG